MNQSHVTAFQSTSLTNVHCVIAVHCGPLTTHFINYYPHIIKI